MRVLFLNRSYYPDVEATGQLLTELCEDLADRFAVSVIAGQPNWNAEAVDYRPHGLEQRSGVSIRRVRHTRFSKRWLAGRLVNQLSFFVSAVFAAWTADRPDVAVVQTDPPFLCLLSGLLRRRFGCRLVLYLQDIYPDVAVALGKLPQGFPTSVVRRWLHGVYRRADLVIVLSEDMRATLLQAGVADERIVVLPNWADTRHIRPLPQHKNRFRREHGLEGQFVVMYSGNMGLSQRLEDILEAARRLQDRRDIVFLLVGGGAQRAALEGQAQASGLANVGFVDYQSRRDLPHSLSAADLHLLPFDPRVVPSLMPSKLYGILASGTPLVALAPHDCELARIVRREEVGFVVPPGDVAGLASRIRWSADHPEELEPMARRARRLAVDCYDRRSTTRRFGELLSGLFSPPLRSAGPAAEASASATESPLPVSLPDT